MITVSPLTPRDQPGLVLAPRPGITGLRLCGTDQPPLALAPDRRQFTLGADGCDLVIPRSRSTAVSALHAVLERIGDDTLRVQDLDSANGLFATRGAPRARSLQLHGGDTFWIADVALQATDPYLDALRAHLACHLGLTRLDAIDDAITAIAGDRPLVLVGPLGTGARRLADVIHATSVHRDRPFIVGSPPLLGLVRHAPGATVFVDLDDLDRLPASIAAALFDPAHGLRLIFAATSEARARGRLDHYRDRLTAIALAPLATRPDDIAPILQFHWATELDTSLRVEQLGPAALRALAAHRWPQNLDELFDHAPRLLAFLSHPTLRSAAEALGVTRQTLTQHLDRLGVPTRLRRDHQPPPPDDPHALRVTRGLPSELCSTLAPNEARGRCT